MKSLPDQIEISNDTDSDIWVSACRTRVSTMLNYSKVYIHISPQKVQNVHKRRAKKVGQGSSEVIRVSKVKI